MTPARLKCRSCGTEFPFDGDVVECPECGETYEGLAGLGGSRSGPKSRGPVEKDVQLEIKRMATQMGFHVTDTSQPHVAKVTPGVPDLYLMHPEWELALWVEVKGPDTPVRESQEAWHAIAGASGVNVTIARSCGDLVDHLRELGAPIETG